MENMKEKGMDLNKETAMRLWNKSFGNATTVIDFSGREMAKGAYNDRNSSKGWNVDHILPQSKGGITADYNLVCCNIETNDEKADSFPCFVANGKRFEIIKVQNHYEIRPVLKRDEKEQGEEYGLDEKVNFYDSAAGIRYFKDLKGIQNKKRWVGTVQIKLSNVQNHALIDFIETIFEDENIYFDYKNSETTVFVKDYNLPFKFNIEDLLDKCILLNTYLKCYFKEVGYLDDYEILYRVDCFEDKNKMYMDSQKQDSKWKNGIYDPYNVISAMPSLHNRSSDYQNTLLINELAYLNTNALEKENWDPNTNGYMVYDYYYTNLSKNLKKETNYSK